MSSKFPSLPCHLGRNGFGGRRAVAFRIYRETSAWTHRVRMQQHLELGTTYSSGIIKIFRGTSMCKNLRSELEQHLLQKILPDGRVGMKRKGHAGHFSEKAKKMPRRDAHFRNSSDGRSEQRYQKFRRAPAAIVSFPIFKQVECDERLVGPMSFSSWTVLRLIPQRYNPRNTAATRAAWSVPLLPFYFFS